VKLGLKPPRPGAVRLRLATYLNYRKLPVPPAEFGHPDLVATWGMLGNGPDPSNPPTIPDGVGDCGFCGAAHMSMLWCAESRTPQSFDTASVLANYSAVTGFDASKTDPKTGDNPTDTGVDLDDLAKYWRQTGMGDAAGNRHQIAAYADMTPGDVRELWVTCYLFQGACLGFALPQSAMDAFAAHKVWDDVGDTNILGGHCVPAFGRHGGDGDGVTWGARVQFTPQFYVKYNNQGVCAFSQEMLVKGKNINGFDAAGLAADVAAITTV
jgi:hypothetical protein